MTSRRVFGLVEIAEAIGQGNAQIVRVWYARGKLPPPTETLASGPIWLREDIESWIDDAITNGGRPPERRRGPKKREAHEHPR